MAINVVIVKPSATKASAPTFYVCGNSTGLVDVTGKRYFVTVQIFNSSMQQLASQTVQVDAQGCWSYQFTLTSNPPPAPPYVAQATGYTTNDGTQSGTVTGSAAAAPVNFCCNTGGDNQPCPQLSLWRRFWRWLFGRRC